MATAYDEWKTTDDRISARDEARAEFIAERTEELIIERMADEELVAEAISEYIGYEDEGESLVKAMARFRAAFDVAQADRTMAEAGLDLFNQITAVADAFICRGAETDASSEAAKRFPDYDDRDPEGLLEDAA